MSELQLHIIDRKTEECSCGASFKGQPNEYTAHAILNLRKQLTESADESKCNNPFFKKESYRLHYSNCVLDKHDGDTHVFIALESLYTAGGNDAGVQLVIITVAPFNLTGEYNE